MTPAVSALGIIGTLAAGLLTQRNANRREDVRFHRESAERHTAWLREQRLEMYVELSNISRDYARELSPAFNVLERQDDPDSELNHRRVATFDAIYRCQLLAGERLLLALRALADEVENVGHRPFQDQPAREQLWRVELFRETWRARAEVEAAVRDELGLAPRRSGNDGA